MKTRAMNKLLDLAKRLPSVELLDSTEISPLLEAARTIKAAQEELEQIVILSLTTTGAYKTPIRTPKCFRP